MLDLKKLSPQKQNKVNDFFIDLNGKRNVKMNENPVSMPQDSSVVALDFIQNGLCTLEFDDKKYELKLGGVLDFEAEEKNDRDGLTYYHFLYEMNSLYRCRNDDNENDKKLKSIQEWASKLLTEETVSVSEIDSIIKEIQKALPKIKAICSKPQMGMTTVEILQDTAKTKRINRHTIQHLASHSENWKTVVLGEIVPKKLLSEIGENDINIYENRFFKKAIDDLSFLIREEKTLFDKIRQKGISERKKNINECSDAFLRIKSSSFYKSISDKTPLKNIYPTNILNYDQRYRALYNLWNTVIRKNKKIKEKTTEETDREFDFKKIGSYYFNFFELLFLSALYEIQNGDKGLSWLEPQGNRDYTSLFNEYYELKEEDGIKKLVFPKIEKNCGYISVSIEKRNANNAPYIEVKYLQNYHSLPESFDNAVFNKEYSDSFSYDRRFLVRKKPGELPSDLFLDKQNQKRNFSGWNNERQKALNDMGKSKTLVFRAFPIRFGYDDKKHSILRTLWEEDREHIKADAFAYVFPNDPIDIRNREEEYVGQETDQLKKDFSFFMHFKNPFQDNDDLSLSFLPAYRAFVFKDSKDPVYNSFHCYNIKSIKKFLYIQYAFFLMENNAMICPICGSPLNQRENDLECNNRGCQLTIKSKSPYSPRYPQQGYEGDTDFPSSKDKNFDDIWNDFFEYNKLQQKIFSF